MGCSLSPQVKEVGALLRIVERDGRLEKGRCEKAEGGTRKERIGSHRGGIASGSGGRYSSLESHDDGEPGGGRNRGHCPHSAVVRRFVNGGNPDANLSKVEEGGIHRSIHGRVKYLTIRLKPKILTNGGQMEWAFRERFYAARKGI